MNEFINAFIDEFEKVAKRKQKRKVSFFKKIEPFILPAIWAGLLYYRMSGPSRYRRYASGAYRSSYGAGYKTYRPKFTSESAMRATGINPKMPREQMVGIKRQAALRFHPDRPGGSATKMKDYNEAWQYLKTQGMTKGASIYFYNSFFDELGGK